MEKKTTSSTNPLSNSNDDRSASFSSFSTSALYSRAEDSFFADYSLSATRFLLSLSLGILNNSCFCRRRTGRAGRCPDTNTKLVPMPKANTINEIITAEDLMVATVTNLKARV